jgi:glycosyltransferase involved in cell wall biosynthesis
MRILQVLHWFLPQHTAGSEIYTYHLAQELDKRHEVAIYTREESERGTREELDETYKGLRVHRVYEPPPEGMLRLDQRALRRFRNPAIERSFRTYLDRFRPDVVHAQHLFKLSGNLIQIAQARGIRTVVTLHDYWFLCYNGQLLRPGLQPCTGPLGGLRCPGCAELPLAPAWRRVLSPLLWPLFLYRTRFLRRCLSQADALVSPSAYLAGVFERHGFPLERILVSDNGTNLSWQAQAARPPHEKLRFGYIGTLAPHKGVHILLEAFAGLETAEAELHVYGGAGADETYARRLRERYGAIAQFRGPFAHDQISDVLNAIDVLVVPSVWAENSPVTIHEAQIAGVPVIASDIGGMTALVREGRAGWLVPSGDIDALRHRLISLIATPEQLSDVQETMKPVKSIAAQARELEALYRRLCRAYTD